MELRVKLREELGTTLKTCRTTLKETAYPWFKKHGFLFEDFSGLQQIEYQVDKLYMCSMH